MQMTESEIVKSYQNAETPRKQIKILAELNACDRQVINDILVKHGCTLPATGNRFTGKAEQKTEQKMVEEQNPAEQMNLPTVDPDVQIIIPDEVVVAVLAEIGRLNRSIEADKASIREIQAAMEKAEQTKKKLAEFIGRSK